MPCRTFAMPKRVSDIALSYCRGKVKNVSQGIQAMHAENKEQRTEIQMLREVNARLRKGWCVKEE